MVTNSKAASLIQDLVFDRLVTMDENMQIKPGLATSWTLLPDNRTWQFKLREDVKFSDGEAFDAETVKYALDRGLDPNNKFTGGAPGYIFTTIALKQVDVVDKYTVNLVCGVFEPDTPGYLAEVHINSINYIKNSPLEVVAQAPIGSGPYKMVEWVLMIISRLNAVMTTGVPSPP